MNSSAGINDRSFRRVSTNRGFILIKPGCSSFDRAAGLEVLHTIEICSSASELDSSHEGLHFLIDMQNVDFLDSSGLRGLLMTVQVLNDLGGSLSLCSLQAPVSLVFEITRMDRFFAIFDSYDAFVAHLLNARQTEKALAAA